MDGFRLARVAMVISLLQDHGLGGGFTVGEGEQELPFHVPAPDDGGAIGKGSKHNAEVSSPWGHQETSAQFMLLAQGIDKEKRLRERCGYHGIAQRPIVFRAYHGSDYQFINEASQRFDLRFVRPGFGA